MSPFFLLLFKINLVLALFAAAYYLVLRKLTFYSVNRAFLMFGILFSSAYPFIDLSELFGRYSDIAAAVPQFNGQIVEYVQNENAEIWFAATLLFWAGVVIMAFRLALQFFSLYRIHQKSRPDAGTTDKIRILTDALAPFSFWQTIYVNPKLHDHKDLKNIIEHERIHVEQWHTLDIILSELSLVFYWFNPGIWLMKKAVRENIEFITDARILKKGVDRKSYQYSLLHAGQLVPGLAIANNFSLSDLRKRIIMMNARRSSPLALSRYLFVLPVLLLTTLAFTFTRKTETEKTTTFKSGKIETEAAGQLPQPQTEKKSQGIPAKKASARLTITKSDTLKNVVFFRNLDSDSSAASGGLDVLPEPSNGRQIRMITIRRDSLKTSDEEKFAIIGSLIGEARKSLPVHHDDDKMRPGDMFVIRKISQGTANTIMKFYQDGKEITEEEFRKIDLKSAAAKDLRIEVRKNSMR